MAGAELLCRDEPLAAAAPDAAEAAGGAMGLRGAGEVTVGWGSEGAADGEVEGGAEASEGGKPTRRRQAAQVQLFWQDGQRQLIRSSADMWLITCW